MICDNCEGSGTRFVERISGWGNYTDTVECQVCKGTGRLTIPKLEPITETIRMPNIPEFDTDGPTGDD
jgi:hypothetical protein